MKKMSVAAGDETLMIELPGLQAVVIDPRRGIVAVDNISGAWGPAEGIEWRVFDLRDGIYGDFHRLAPAGNCIDHNCYASSQHVINPATTGQAS